MRAKTLEKSEITGERLAKDNAEIVFGDMSKYLCFNDAGEPYGDRARCSPEELDLLSEVTVEKTGGKNGITRTKIKPHDRMQAFDRLAEWLKVFKDDGADPVDELLAAMLAETDRRRSCPPCTRIRPNHNQPTLRSTPSHSVTITMRSPPIPSPTTIMLCLGSLLDVMSCSRQGPPASRWRAVTPCSPR